MYFSSLLLHTSSLNEPNAPRRLMIYSYTPKSAKIPHDVRNGPGRLRESPHELAYLRDLACQLTPAFSPATA